MNKTFNISFFLILFSIVLFGQNNTQKDTIYLDENITEISRKLFLAKCNAAIFHCKSDEKDSIIENHIYYKFYFGKMTVPEFERIQNHFNKKTAKDIYKGQTLLIYHRDTLFNFVEGRKRDLGYNDSIKLSPKRFKHLKNRATKFKNKWNKEKYQQAVKFEKKYNTATLFVANYNFDEILENEHFTWLIDETSILKNSYIESIIILKPNGEYFINYGQFSEENLTLLLKNDWNQYQNDWERSLKANYSIGYGIIKLLTEKKQIKFFQ